MDTTRSPRRSRLPGLLLASCLVLGAVALVLLGIPGVGSPGMAQADEALKANSVCEAQELKEAKRLDPSLAIEIPAEFDRPFPSLSACRSHDLAWDEDAPGPNQPIPFSHAHHAGEFEIECLYCHAGTDRSKAAGVPSVELCMGCHSAFPAEYDELEGIRILKKHWEERETIPWVQIHRLPEHAKFRHNRHVSDYAKSKGVECQTCHGPVEKMHKLYLDTDMSMGPVGLPTKPLEMGWCINCHRENEVSQDCFTCHY